jgi:apolipoprotein N-acyltransferase
MALTPPRSDRTETAHGGLPMVLPTPGEPNEGWLARVMRILFGWKAAATRADLELVLTAEQPESGFSPAEAAMLKNILGLRECRIESVMVQRPDIVAVQQEITIGELVMVFAGAGHSRLVVYNDTLDDPTGMVHIRDLLAFMAARAAIDPAAGDDRKALPAADLDLAKIDLSMPLRATRIVREILYAPPSMPALDLLAKMQATRIHLALIIDEYGGSDGLVSIEDLVELIVGDIADEHDEAETAAVTPQGDGSFLATGRASLDDVRAVIGEEFDVGDAAQEVDTLGGYLVMRAGHVPVRGELVPGPGAFEAEVLDADPRRVKRVKIYRSKDRRPGTAREVPALLRPAKFELSAAAVKPTAAIDAIILSFGWRRWLIAFAAGALSALAMAPVNAWPILFLTFPTLVWLIDGAKTGWPGVTSAAAAGWWFGFGYFLAGLYWIGYAFLVDAPTFGWLLPIAVIGLPAGLGFFTAFGAALARLLWTRGALRILALGVGLTAAEYLRGHVLTGFPWNTFGYALTSPLALAQAASVIGVWGLTFIAIIAFASPATLADDRADTRRAWLPLLLALAALAGLGSFGALRLAGTPTELVDGARLRIMQPNLQQDVRFNYAAKQQVIDRYVALSDRISGPQSRGAADATHLIWPESAFPFFLAREPDALAQITQLLRGGTVLITGAVRLAEPVNPADPAAYNSIYVIDHDGSLVSLYDKVHLVPFGEYLPFQHLLESFGLQELTKQRGGFLAGDRRRLLSVPGAPPALPLICYEIIFPGEAIGKGPRPGWIVNLTNDGWFGISSGPYQHLQQARVRAIEEGLPLARAANTGISAVVDPVGRILKSLPLGSEGIIDSPLPRPIDSPLYVRLGDIPVAMMLAVALVAIIWRRLQSTP